MTDLSVLLEEYGIVRFLENVGAENINVRGNNIRSSCPIHQGDNPSAFSYYEGKFTCFSTCNRVYNPIEVIMYTLGQSYQEAKETLEGWIGHDIDSPPVLRDDQIQNRSFIKEYNRIFKKKPVEEDTLYTLDESIYEKITHPYLKAEGFTDHVRKYFDLRYTKTQPMANRIIIPVDRPDGKIIGLAGRATVNGRELEEQGIFKYYFTKGFRKTKTLYNISRISPLEDFIIVVEGYKSVWRLHQWGYRNAVATMGVQLSPEQKKLLLSLNVPILVCGDNDAAGRKLEEAVFSSCHRFSPVEIFPIELTQASPKDSIAEISREEFEHWKDLKMTKYPVKTPF